jgi:glycosyltransferase involved in cell wall biosynthesis
MCDAFVKTGEEVVYIHGKNVGDGGKITWDDVAEYYGLETRFRIRTFRNLHQMTGRFTKIGTISMAGPLAAYPFLEVLAGRFGPEDVIYGREYYPLYFVAELLSLIPADRRPSVYFEQHTPTSKRFTGRFYERIDGVVCITERLADAVARERPIDREQILVAPDGVDPEPYENRSQADARAALGLPADETIVTYTGHLYEGKGGETLVAAAAELDASVYVVGGYEEDIQRVQSSVGQPDNVVFTGFVDPAEIPRYQTAADVLVAPYTEASRPWVSPLKLFEYMAAGRPIVASDREVLKEVLVDGENALLFPASDADALRAAIKRVLASEELANRLVTHARETVEAHTWQSRAAAILDWVEKRRDRRRTTGA